MHTQVRAIWSVPGGGTGYSVFNLQGAVGAVTVGTCLGHLRTFFNALVARIPNEVTVAFDPEFTHHDPSGGLVAAGTAAVPATVNGTYAGGWVGAAGARIDWETATVINKRRIRGRTYLVPLGAIFDTDGSLLPAEQTSITNAANTLLVNLQGAAAPLVVWSKVNAAEVLVVSPSVRDKSAVLRSRRE